MEKEDVGSWASQGKVLSYIQHTVQRKSSKGSSKVTEFKLKVLPFSSTAVSGTSMMPSIQVGAVGLVNLWSRKLKRNNIVVIKIPSKDKYLIKRIVGLSGEIIDVSPDGHFKVNKTLFNEPNDLRIYGQSRRSKTCVHINLKENEYFVLGDNRPVSLDSRDIGPIQRSQIVGKVVFLVNPDKSVVL